MLRSKALILLGISSFFLGFVFRVQFAGEPHCASVLPVTETGDDMSYVSSPKDFKERQTKAVVGGTWNDENDAVLGLARSEASWKTEFKMFVGTLRHTGYRGRIVLFVHPTLAAEAVPGHLREVKEYLHSRNVELIGVKTTPCEFSFKPEVPQGYDLRKHCTVEYPLLQLEWGRFAMARDWLERNPKTGWFLTSDVRDTFFQRPPFADLGPPTGDQAFVYEEYYGDEEATIQSGKTRGIDCTHWFCKMSTKCYGQDAWEGFKAKPMLCSGQILGNHQGALRVLNSYIDEMLRNGRKGPSCVPPVLPDQPLLNYLVWTGALNVTTTKYGDGPIMTIGGTCTTNNGKRGLRDLLSFDENQMILDNKGRTVPVVHQWDRCGDWMERWLRQYLASFGELKLEKKWSGKEAPTAPAPPPKVYQNKKGDKWQDCCEENGTCHCKTVVRFGTDDKWSMYEMDKEVSIACLNDMVGGVFPDPAPGKPKMCQCRL